MCLVLLCVKMCVKMLFIGDKEEQQLEFRIIDYGHARLLKNKALAKLPSAPNLELSYRK